MLIIKALGFSMEGDNSKWFLILLMIRFLSFLYNYSQTPISSYQLNGHRY